MDWCQFSGKIMYQTRKEAQQQIAGTKRRTGFDRPLTTYACEHCGCWHLTKVMHHSNRKKKFKKGKHR